MQDDVYKGMFIPKGSVIIANALCVPAAPLVPLDADDLPASQEYGMGRQSLF
jgi:hypothetical protein